MYFRFHALTLDVVSRNRTPERSILSPSSFVVAFDRWPSGHEEVELAAPTYLALMRDGQVVARPPFLPFVTERDLYQHSRTAYQ